MTALDILSRLYALSRSETRRLLAQGGFYVQADEGWRALAEDSAFVSATGRPTRKIVLFRRGKRDIRPAEFVVR